MARVRALLVEAAREGCGVSYAGLLGRLGIVFTRSKMRALCRTLDRIDREAVAAGEPELAVLVVRESDGLPGQGWWMGHAARRQDMRGAGRDRRRWRRLRDCSGRRSATGDPLDRDATTLTFVLRG